jgi:hypothetical protein
MNKMIKDWKNFNLIKEDNQFEPINGRGLQDYIADNFYFLFDSKVNAYLFKSDFYYMDDTNWIREDIKIGEKLTPSVFVGIRFRESSIINDDLLRSIKISIKKLKVYCKLKHGLKLKTNIIDTNSDFYNYEDFLSSNITKHTKDDKEPLNKLSVIDNTLKFNASETQSFNMTGLLISLTNDEKREITPLDFANFYNLRNFKVNKDGDLYVDINIEKIASILYNEPNIIYKDVIYVTNETIKFLKEKLNDKVTTEDKTIVSIVFNPNTMLENYKERSEPSDWGSYWGNDIWDDCLYSMVLEYLNNWNGELNSNSVY